MTIYEIDKEIENCVDPETGEFDEEKFNGLAQLREEKIEQLIRFYKNTVALASAVKVEEKRLKEHKEAIEKRAESIKNYISYILAGEKFESATSSVRYTHTTATECPKDFVEWALEHNRNDLLSYGKPTANKTAIKAALESGEKDIPAKIVNNVNTIIK